jgi:hypothetical protein
MQNQTNTNTSFTTENNGETNTNSVELGTLSRSLLSQQSEILIKLDVLLERQARVELALQAAILSNGNGEASKSVRNLINNVSANV